MSPFRRWPRVIAIAIHFARFGGKMILGNRDNFPFPAGLAGATPWRSISYYAGLTATVFAAHLFFKVMAQDG